MGTDAVASGAGRRMASVAQRKRRGGGWTIAAKMDWWRRRLVQKSRNAHFTKPRNRENVMLTRRTFTGVVSCAICAVASEFLATEAEAQAAPPAATAGVTRKILSHSDGPAAGYETLLVEATIEAGVAVGRHTHPGIESAYVLEGGFELPIQGQPTRIIKAGDAFQIPPETPHAGGKPGNAKSRILITYVVQKGKPLASPA